MLCELAESDERVFLLTPDMGYSVLEGFAERFPGRFINTGIAEQNTVSVAAGLALCGRIVYVYSIIPFVTMRCYEQVRLDLAYNGARVRLVGIGAGLTYGSLGPSHHAYEDIALMRAVPGMRVLCPGDPFEVEQLMRQCHESGGPVVGVAPPLRRAALATRTGHVGVLATRAAPRAAPARQRRRSPKCGYQT